MSRNTLGNAQRWQPQRPVRINQAHPLSKGLLFSAWNSAVDVLLPPFDYVTNRFGTMASVSHASDALSVSNKFNGTASKAQFTNLNMGRTAPRLFTVTFSLWWDTYASDLDVCLEYGAATYNTGVNGWLVTPNSTGGNWLAAIGMSGGNSCGTNIARSNAPVGAWYDFAILFNRNNTTKGTEGIYVDGVVTSFTTSGSFPTAVDNSNTNFNIMCRNNASNFGAGRLRNLNIYDHLLSSDEIASLHSNPYQIVAPIKRVIYMLDGFGDPQAGARKSRYYIAT